MAVERSPGGTSLIDVLDRVLDKGIVIDAWVPRARARGVSLVGIDLITVEARVVVASIDTYLKYSDAIGAAASASRPTVKSHASSFSLRNDDDDDNGDGGGGSSGAPATLRVEIQPRRRPLGVPERTRRR